MDSKIIAVDFDGTLCENKWPEIGEPIQNVIEYVLEEKKKGAKLILWTNRVDERLEEAVRWCKEKGILFDAVNDNLTEVVESFGSNCRKIFANEYIDDRNRLISSCRKKSTLETWAEKEVEIACHRENPDRKDGEWDYGCACYESALKAFSSLCEDDHSGFSICMTKHILNRLIEGKPLVPIEDSEDVWSDCRDVFGHEGEVVNYQCKRMSSLFKYVYSDGTVKYKDVDRYAVIDVNNPNVSYHNGFISNIMDELFSITMPYIPYDKAFRVYREDFLVDQKNGDYDTIGILYVITPTGDRVEINRYFKEGSDSFLEISKDEYEERRVLSNQRLER